MTAHKNKNVDIIFDLEIFDEQYGSYIEKNPRLASVRPHIDHVRTSILRDTIGKRLLNGFEYVRPDAIMYDLEDEAYQEELSYVKDYLKHHSAPASISDFYYMRLKKSSNIDNLYFLEIILKPGFLTQMELNPSENYIKFLQDILRLLFDNEISDKDIVGYYMNLLTQDASYFKNSINNI